MRDIPLKYLSGLLLLLLATLVYSFIQFGRTSDDQTVTPKTNAPRISSISTSKGTTGDAVQIHGTGFTENDNSIVFTSGQLSGYLHNLKSLNGTSFTFTIPGGLDLCSPTALRTNKPCPGGAYPQLYAGDYTIAVENANGISNRVNFTITPTFH